MTTQKNSRQARDRAAAQLRAARSVHAPVEFVAETQGALIERLHRMANEVELLQTEIAAVEAFVTDPVTVVAEGPEVRNVASAAAPVALAAVRPGSTWTPTPTPQPWLVARSA